MLEKGSWPDSSDGAFPCPSNNARNGMASGTANEENKTSNHCLEASSMGSSEELCNSDPILSDHVAEVESDSYLHSLTEPVDDLSFLDNEQADKENGNLLFYNWPEIESFEDVDKLFRSFDSTFGFGINNEDNLGWFSFANGTEESDDATMPSFKIPSSDFCSFNGATEHDGAFSTNNICCLADETDKDFTTVSWNSSLMTSNANSATVTTHSSCGNREGISCFDSDTQKISLEDQLKTQYPSDVERDDVYLENGEAFVHLNNINQPEEMGQPVNESCYQCTFSLRSEHKLQNVFLNGLHSQNPHMDPGGNDPPNDVLPSPIPSLVKSEDNGQSISQKESSNGSNQMLSAKNSCGFRGGKKKGISGQNGISACQNNHGKSFMISNPVIAQNQVASFESEIEGQSEFNANGTTRSFPAELDSSNVQESCLSSVLDEVSLEASSFCQLQHVMEKLDIKTKLCIRDSLYRLARSAERRHKCSGSRFDKNGNGIMVSDETDRCNGFMDMETDTNPIDRSIAHLLFHRPSDPSIKPLTMVHTSNNDPALAAEKPISQEESSTAVAE